LKLGILHDDCFQSTFLALEPEQFFKLSIRCK